jgi:hypothetical protein
VRRHIAEYSSDPKNKILYGIVVRFWCSKNLVDQNIFLVWNSFGTILRIKTSKQRKGFKSNLKFNLLVN